jgi:hypothetical protein
MTELAALRGIVRAHVMAPGNRAAAPEAAAAARQMVIAARESTDPRCPRPRAEVAAAGIAGLTNRPPYKQIAPQAHEAAGVALFDVEEA